MHLYRIDYNYNTGTDDNHDSMLVLANSCEDAVQFFHAKLSKDQSEDYRVPDREIVSVFREYSDEIIHLASDYIL